MTEVSFICSFAAMVNLVMFMLFPTFVYSLVKFPDFRRWVVALVEDGDGIANKHDARDAVILFFAVIIGWVLVNIIFVDLIFGKDMIFLIGVVAGIFFTLLGISQLKKH